VSQPLAHLYDLALRTLDEQERRADALHGRLGPVLAAAALGASLLSGPLIGGGRPASVAGKLSVALALGGLLVALAVAFRLLAERRQPLDRLDPHAVMLELRAAGLLEDERVFYATMIARIQDDVGHNTAAIERLASLFTAMLWGILSMLCGLALAALVG